MRVLKCSNTLNFLVYVRVSASGSFSAGIKFHPAMHNL